MDCAQEKGASSWLTALPLEEFNLTLHKGAFRDAIALRYGWQPINVQSKCACGRSFTIDHALSCPMGGFPTIRHNEIRDFTANLMSEVCHDVCVEPTLQPVTGEVLNGASGITDDGAKLDVAANGFWGGRHERAYFDVRVFPFKPATFGRLLQKTRKHQEESLRTESERDRAWLLHSNCAVSHRGPWQSSNNVLQEARLNDHCQTRPALQQHHLLDQMPPVLLLVAIQCIRGARSACGCVAKQPVIPGDLVSSEARIPRC
jgi:hypothetical protein